MEQSDIKLLFYELNLLQELSHPNITKVIEFFEDKERFYAVYDHPNFEDLYDLITKEEMSEDRAKHIIREVLTCVNYLSYKSIVHRDLKPENILISGSHVQVHGL